MKLLSRSHRSQRPAPRLAPRLALALALAALPLPATASAQAPSLALDDWKRVETEHFLFLYPEELSEWALQVASRMEAVHEAVASLVGYAPEDRVTVVVDDPGNVSNGALIPGPLIFIWPTPPDPRSMIGENRGWGEILAVHEFAHAAHLYRPSRNPLGRLVESVLPLPVTRIMFRTPRWATEGYATYVEGRLTGSGRPHGVWRPAVLRTWALEGQLPTYGAVSGASGFYGGAMAYLVGSAFLEWLVEREGRGEEVLPDVWARLTARQDRSFDAAFTGVFGASPAELYGLFKVDVTERALAVREAVESAGGPVDGELFQRLSWYTGDPAVSPDGERLALVLRSEEEPSRLVVISTTPDTLTTKARERRAEVFAKDPEDVEPVERRPRQQKPESTLYPALGMEYRAPAWMPDGTGILVVRGALVENERVRPDLFLWDWEDGGVRRVTHGAAIREADPAPDGTWAAGLRCLHGNCDIVRIDLATGDVSTIAEGGPLSPWFRPRVSPDGRTIVASRQIDGRWRLLAMDADGSGQRFLGPDDGAARFDAEWMPDGETLVLVSTRGGIHDLELLDAGTGRVRPLTRVIGAAVAPSPDREGDVFFLSLHSRGWDLRRIAVDSAPATPAVAVSSMFAPAAPVGPEVVDTFPAATTGPIRGYGLGPRSFTLLPYTSLASDGYAGGLALASTDPIGKLSWQAQGQYGSDEAWRGGSLRVLWRGFRPWLHLEGFWADERHDAPDDDFPVFRPGGVGAADRDGLLYRGGAGALELRVVRLAHSHHLRAGGSWGWLDSPGLTEAERLIGFGGYDLDLRQSIGAARLGQSVNLHGSVGRTADARWLRWLAEGSLSIGGSDNALVVAGSMGATDAPAGSPERFTIGGTQPLLFEPALLSQRIAMPGLPAGFLHGRAVRTVRAELAGSDGVRSFFWAGDAEGDGIGWYRVAGSELVGDGPAVPYVRLPASRFRLGLARTFDEPEKGVWRGWFVVAFRP